MKEQRHEAKNQVFSHPIRRLNVDELEKVVGGNSCASYKSCGGADNQGKDWG